MSWVSAEGFLDKTGQGGDEFREGPRGHGSPVSGLSRTTVSPGSCRTGDDWTGPVKRGLVGRLNFEVRERTKVVNVFDKKDGLCTRGAEKLTDNR